MLGSPAHTTTTTGWRRRKGGRQQFRCVFLQAGVTHSWLDIKRIRRFREEDTGEGRGTDYVTKAPRWVAGHTWLGWDTVPCHHMLSNPWKTVVCYVSVCPFVTIY